MRVKAKLKLDTEQMRADVCVVGGGLAGVCAAIAAARNGAKTILIQDRPVLGGNASSEVRMWISGARGTEQREAGILEELLLENQYRNPGLKYTIWDHVLYSKVKFQQNLELLLNTSVVETRATDDEIQSVRAWQLSTQKWLEITAGYFIDCSGDSILRYCGAGFFSGRENQATFNEPLAIELADECTLGNSILLQLREVDEHVPFLPPDWAYQFNEADLPNRILKAQASSNFWWLEVGGMQDTIRDAETIRDELLKIAYGVWACIKNHPDGRGQQWELEWIGSLPGKRENIRYHGEHILCQQDISSGGKFDDIIAYGGWPMDDHHPEGIHYKGRPTIFNESPSPYGIPLKCLYSANIKNLFFAGRNISATHMAFGSTRVMGTCAIMGQAAGTAAALIHSWSIQAGAIDQTQIKEIQNTLLDQDCYLPGILRHKKETIGFEIDSASGPNLYNGVDRQLKGQDNGVWVTIGEPFEITLESIHHVKGIRLVHDSDFKHKKRLPCSFPLKRNKGIMPSTMMREYLIEYYADEDKLWKQLFHVTNNVQRLDVQRCQQTKMARLRFTLIKSWEGDKAHLFALDIF